MDGRTGRPESNSPAAPHLNARRNLLHDGGGDGRGKHELLVAAQPQHRRISILQPDLRNVQEIILLGRSCSALDG